MDAAKNDIHFILVVDAEAAGRKAISKMLAGAGCVVVECDSAETALTKRNQHPYLAVISEQVLPGMSGVELLESLRSEGSMSLRILMGEMTPPEALIEAINRAEIFRFLPKPLSETAVLSVVAEAAQSMASKRAGQGIEPGSRDLNSELARANSELRCNLALVTEQRDAVDRAHEALRQNFEHSLGLCFRLINTFYPLLGRQAQAVVEICRAMAATEFFSETERHVLMTSAWIYDIGLVALDRGLLHRLFTSPESCSRDEHALLRHHPIIGQTLAAFVDQLQEVGATIRAHHERFDGAGYPDGLAGENIPWTARCLAVAVAFVQSGLPKELASEFVREESGRGFDPEAVRLFFRTSRVDELPRNVTEVLLAELAPGMELARGIVTPSGMLLVPEGQILTEMAIHKLVNHSMLRLVTERLMIYA